MRSILLTIGFALTSVGMAQEDSHLQQAASLTGIVQTETGAPIPKAVVAVDNRFQNIHHEAIASIQGAYELSDLPPGNYTVWAESTLYGCILMPHVVLAAGETKRLDFVFHRARTKSTCNPTSTL